MSKRASALEARHRAGWAPGDLMRQAPGHCPGRIPMTILPKCVVANGEDIFCVLGNLYQLDPQGETLHYMRPCSCPGCVKTARFRKNINRIVTLTFDERSGAS
jgi:hypothetical protein